MRIAGNFLRIASFAVGILGAAVGFFAARSDIYSVTGVAIIVGSLIGWAVLYGVGTGFLLIENVAIDASRSADALEALAERRKARPHT